ncbi:MAG: tetratricopeptide repeat protein, partial [Rhodospirillales bacterium]|nr:tetratricopeptide repeat protein [Rhodospirillales bacterium]
DLLYQALLLRAGAYKQNNQPQPAAADVARAILLKPNAPQGYAVRAELEQAAEPQAAIADDSKAIALDPKFLAAYEDRAVAYGSQHKYAEAAADEATILQLHPNAPGDLNNRCWFLALDDRLTQALGYCQKALSLDPSNAATLDSTGFVYLKLKNNQQAINYYTQALKADPTLATSLYGRALAEQAGGDQKAAAADMALARRYDTNIEQDFGS